MCTVEAPIHINVKKAIVDAKETDTALLLKPLNNSVRCYRNDIAKKVEHIERTQKEYEFSEVAPYMTGKRGKIVYADGDVNYGIWSVGQAQGLIHDIPTCKELVQRLERETIDILSSTPKVIISNDGARL
jgi:NAD(P)H-dependent flavin oxidoreductase YrpB (nitropropane dioxygenase family)